jgi:hypothetical protein
VGDPGRTANTNANGSQCRTPGDRIHDTGAKVQRAGLSLSPEVRPGRTCLQLPEGLRLPAWCRIGEQIGLIGNSSAWWLGDWIVYGQKRFPNRYRQAIEKTSLDYQTLRNYAWVARRFPMSRRRDTLSFQHHAAVAALAESEQDLWLDRAAVFAWSLQELRKQLKSARTDQRSPQERLMLATLQLKVSAEKMEIWKAAAEAAQQDMLEWVVSIVDEAAGNRAE